MKEENLILKYIDKEKQKKAYQKLKKGIPVQYIIGNVDFYGYKFFVNKNVLIPRFETEYLIEKLIKLIKKNFSYPVKIADLGTGSGVIAITLKKEIDASVAAFDISNKALKVAKKNAKLNQVSINLQRRDIRKQIAGKYDVIVSNPPYIGKKDTIEPKVLKHEPKLALFAKNNGLEYYEKILSYAGNILNEKNIIAFEIGMNQGDDILKITKKYFNNAKVFIEKDLTGKNRYIFIINE